MDYQCKVNNHTYILYKTLAGRIYNENADSA